MNRNCPARNTILQLLTPYANSEPSKGGNYASKQKLKSIKSRLQFETASESAAVTTSSSSSSSCWFNNSWQTQPHMKVKKIGRSRVTGAQTEDNLETDC